MANSTILRARAPLKPKSDNPIRAIGLALKRAGYDPIATRGAKGKLFVGWRRERNDEATILRWNGKGVSIRTSGDIFIIDIDVRTSALRDQILEMLTKRWPDFMATCARRHSGSTTLALFGRAATKKWKHARSHRYRHDEKLAHLVEVFTGNAKRHVVVYGPHSEGREYAFIGRPLWETPITELPMFEEKDIGPMLDACEAIMTAAGLERVAPASSGGRRVVFDLLPDMVIVLKDDGAMTLAELEKIVGMRRIECYPTPWDPKSTSARVLANDSTHGLALYDTKTETSHRWAWHKPPESFHEFAARLKSILGKSQ